MRSFAITFGVLFALAIVAVSVGAQTKPRKSSARKTAEAAATPSPTPQPTPETPAEPQPLKRNERPDKPATASGANEQGKSPAVAGDVFIYHFSRPGFTVGDIRIEHDENGNGNVTFTHKDSDEPLTDPILISPVSLKRITEAFDALNFLNSTENYQYEKDYSHLGNLQFTIRRNGRERTAGFNWTENKIAKTLADEYRKLSNQYVWVFDINLARENQPLEAPKLFSTLDGYLRRNEISDPPQLIPFLKDLVNDERIPLMGRNHAQRLIKQIEKSQDR